MGDIKVTDKRMFTPDGELREDFRHLDREAVSPGPGVGSEATTATPGEDEAAAARSPEPAAEPPRAAPQPPPAAEAGAERPPRLEIPGTPEGLGAPGFLDLVGLLAEPILVYLGDARLPDGSSSENLQLARLHIDLLDVLRQKTAGNLDARESAYLEDLLYQLRMRYVQKRG